VVQQLDQYLTEVQTNATSFWKQKSTIYSWLAPIADNFVCAPASQAYVERIFSVCVCVAFCVVCSSYLKCIRVWNWIRKCCVLMGLLC